MRTRCHPEDADGSGVLVRGLVRRRRGEQRGRMRTPAVGLVHVAAGTPTMDRYWRRGLVVRHARDLRLGLVDVLEVDDNAGPVLLRLAAIAAQSDARVLVTHGLDPRMAGRLAADLDVEHVAVPELRREDLKADPEGDVPRRS